MNEALITAGSFLVHLLLIGICLGIPRRTGWTHDWSTNGDRAWKIGSFLIPEVLFTISLGVILSQWRRKPKVIFPR